jgi:hypothetical protein
MATARQVFDADKMMKRAFNAMKGPRKKKMTVMKKAMLGTPEVLSERNPHRWEPSHAIKTKATDDEAANICLQWAKGKCKMGRLCKNLKKLPDSKTPFREDEDIFGRMRVASSKDTTLEILNVKRTFDVDDQVALRGGTVERVLVDRLRENFEPFGRVTNVSLSVYDEKATLVYATRQAAEFAVEAMDGQVLLPETRPKDAPVLTVRFKAKPPPAEVEDAEEEEEEVEEPPAKRAKKDDK